MKGDQGDTGIKGESGDTGATGPQGDPGPQGATGEYFTMTVTITVVFAYNVFYVHLICTKIS